MGLIENSKSSFCRLEVSHGAVKSYCRTQNIKMKHNFQPPEKNGKAPNFLRFFKSSNIQVQVLDEVQTREVEREETEVKLAIALLVTVILIFAG